MSDSPDFGFFVPVVVHPDSFDPAISTDLRFLQLAVKEAYASIEAYREIVSVALAELGKVNAELRRHREMDASRFGISEDDDGIDPC